MKAERLGIHKNASFPYIFNEMLKKFQKLQNSFCVIYNPANVLLSIVMFKAIQRAQFNCFKHYRKNEHSGGWENRVINNNNFFLYLFNVLTRLEILKVDYTENMSTLFR